MRIVITGIGAALICVALLTGALHLFSNALKVHYFETAPVVNVTNTGAIWTDAPPPEAGRAPHTYSAILDAHDTHLAAHDREIASQEGLLQAQHKLLVSQQATIDAQMKALIEINSYFHDAVEHLGRRINALDRKIAELEKQQ